MKAVASSPAWSGLRVVLAGAGVPVAAASSYLCVLAVAALFYRDEPPASTDPDSRVVVLIPAYNESELIERCVTSLLDQDYDRERYEVVVIADNCTDDTAQIAERAGARVLVRNEPDARGKGRALRWAMDQVLAGLSPPAAIVVVDADSVADPGLLAGLVRRFELGALAVQGEYLALEENLSPQAQLRAAAILLFHRVRFAGRAVLGLPCSLVGNGMLFSGALLAEHPWDAFTSAEDLEYSADLRLLGIKPAFAGGAVVRGPFSSSARGATVQRERWEGGRLHVAKTRLPAMITAIFGKGQTSLVDAAVDLAVPPLGLLALASIGGTAATLSLRQSGAVGGWTVGPWVLASGAIAGFVLVGLRAGRAPASMYISLLRAPVFLLAKGVGTAAVLKNSGGDTWVRTERPNESGQ